MFKNEKKIILAASGTPKVPTLEVQRYKAQLLFELEASQ
jgi:hypothetical protein